MEMDELVPEAARDSNRVIPECQVLYEGGPTSEKLFGECKKNPGHPTFIPVKNFKMEHLPVKFRTQEYMEYVQVESDLTVKVKVKYTSPKRPDMYPDSSDPYPCCGLKGSTRAERCGTGYIVACRYFTPMMDKPCPCHLCKKSDHPEIGYFKVTVRTATHLIFDSLEASKAVFECFFDSNDKEGVQFLYGENVVPVSESRRCITDLVSVEAVTHDSKLFKHLELGVKRSIDFYCRFNSDQRQTPKAFIISHPHGMSKQISFGTVLHQNIPNDLQFLTEVTYRFEIDMLCCLPRNNDIKDKIFCWKFAAKLFQSFKKFMNSSNDPISLSQKMTDLIQRGREYIVPNGTTFTLPSGSKYVYQYNFPKTKSFMLPPMTTFSLPNGSDFFLSHQTEFYSDRYICDIIGSKFYLHYLTYNIATCPGSSGAGIFHFGVPPQRVMHSHAGAVENGINQSSFRRRPEFLPAKRL